MNLENSAIKAPFTAPEGYFEGLEEKLLAEVKISALLQLAPPPVPERYFETLEDQVLAQTRLPLWEPQISPTYFDAMEAQILSRVKIDGLPQPVVENSYFDTLEEEVLLGVKLEGLSDPAIPKGYFESLEKNILKKTTDVASKKFILFRNGRAWRSAAAAVVIGAGAWLSWSPQPKDELANISSAAMVAYLSEQPLMEEDLNFVLDEDEVFLTSEVSDSEINAYLQENGINI